MYLMFQMTFGEQNTEKEAHEMLSYAVERGINALDTAEAVSSFSQLDHSQTQSYSFCLVTFQLCCFAVPNSNEEGDTRKN
jgi:predicted aldo/keto reductase-like oxidoreductase